MDVSPVWMLVGAAVLVVLVSSLHLALVDLARGVLEELASREGRSGAARRRVERILQDLPGHVKAVGLLRVLADALVVLLAVAWVAQLREGRDAGFATLSLADAAIGACVGGAVLWLMGVVIPASVAWHMGERLVFAASALLRLLHRLTAPLRPLERLVDDAVRKLGGTPVRTQTQELEAELMSVVEEGEREGQIDEVERDMIEAVVEFRNLTVEQVMTPRTEVQALEETDDLPSIVSFLRRVGHSRIPVYRGDLDNVLGMLYAKDLLGWLKHGDQPFAMREVLRPALFVPETKTVRELLRELLAKKIHIALVADEYGGTAGLVTIEDIVEEIIGDIRDEYEPSDEDRPQVEVDPHDRTAELDARAYIDEVNDALAPLGVSLPEGDDYDTVGGFISTRLGRIPAVGESLRHGRAVLTVVEASPTRVLKARLEVAPEEGPDAADGARPVVAQTNPGPAPAGRAP